MPITRIALLAFLGCASGAASADVSYTHVDITYNAYTYDLGGVDIDTDGYTLAFSRAVGPNSHTFGLLSSDGGTYERRFTDGVDDYLFHAEVSQALVGIGIGFHSDVSRPVSAFLQAALVAVQADAEVFLKRDIFFQEYARAKDDDTGQLVELGVRGMSGDKLELDAKASMLSVFDDQTTTIELGGRYALSGRTGLTLRYVANDDYDGFRAGVRFTF